MMKPTSNRLNGTAQVLLGLLLLSGCFGARRATFETHPGACRTAVPGSARAAQATALLHTGDEAWAQRQDPLMTAAALTAWEEAAALSPSAETWVKISRGYYYWAQLRALGLAPQGPSAVSPHDAGTAAAEAALACTSPSLAARVRKGAVFEEAIKLTTPEAVPALYWYAANLAPWARSQGPLAVMSNRGRIHAVMTQCLAANPDYFYAGAHRYFGAYYALLPWGAGQDLDKSQAHFKEAITRAPNHLGTRVLMANTLARAQKDHALFEKLLKEVAAADSTLDPDLAPELRLEKIQAAALLDQSPKAF